MGLHVLCQDEGSWYTMVILMVDYQDIFIHTATEDESTILWRSFRDMLQFSKPMAAYTLP